MANRTVYAVMPSGGSPMMLAPTPARWRYTAPGSDHGIFEWPEFYELEVSGVRLMDWVEALIAGEPLDDVH